MHEYIPRWSAPAETLKTPSDGTDKADRKAFVSFVSAPSTRIEPVLPADAAALLAVQDEIVAAASAARDAFDRQHYDRLWERWHALQVQEVT